MDYLSRL